MSYGYAPGEGASQFPDAVQIIVDGVTVEVDTEEIEVTVEAEDLTVILAEND